jgi:transcriptional regulator with XRE-family HTH domain
MILNGLEAVRKAAKKSQERFASDLGMDQSQYSRLESGAQIMGECVSQRLARHIGGSTSAAELALANKAAAFRRAMVRGDRVGVLNAAKSFVQYAEHLPDDPELDRMLDKLVDRACSFAEQATGSDRSGTYVDG